MELSFENTFTSTDGLKTCFSHEPDNTLTKFFANDNKVENKSAIPENGNFSSLSFIAEARRLTHRRIIDFGVKTYPHLGSYGFYTPLYLPTSYVVIPINRTQERRTIPEVTITDTGTTIHVAISGDYICYRVEVRLNQFATEFITYSSQLDFIPMYTGNCLVTVTGFSNEISVISESYEEYIDLVDRT